MNHDETPTEYLRRKGWQHRRKGRNLQVQLCPFCHGGDSGDVFTFAVEETSGAFNCLRGSCGRSGSFFELRREMGDKTAREAAPRAFTPPPKPTIAPVTAIVQPSDKVRAYLALRGFSAETVTK